MSTSILPRLARVAAVCALTVGALSGCGAIKETANCASVCSRYKDCFDGSFDTKSCTEQCQSKSESDKNFARSTDQCQACITDRACSETAFPCATECAGVIITSSK